MNKPIQATDVTGTAHSRPADSANRQSSETESPFSALLSGPGVNVPAATASPAQSAAGPAVAGTQPEALAAVQQEVQTAVPLLVPQMPAGEATAAENRQARVVALPEAIIQLPGHAPATAAPLTPAAGAVAVAAKAVPLQDAAVREAALQLAAGPLPTGEAVRQAQLAGMARAQLATPPEGEVQSPLQAITEALARKPDTTTPPVEMPDTDFSPAARKHDSGAALVLKPDNGALSRGEKPIGELMQLIAGGRSLLPDGATTTAQSQTLASIPLTADAVTDFSLTTPSAIRGQVPNLVGQPGWDRAVGEQALWFISQNIKAASLRLNPAHLGPMEMMVAVDGDKATVAFSSSNAIVREALESAIPRLREMLAENGLNLGDVNVSHQGLSDRRGQRAYGAQAAHDGRPADEPAVDAQAGQAVSSVISSPLGLVDYYA